MTRYPTNPNVQAVGTKDQPQDLHDISVETTRGRKCLMMALRMEEHQKSQEVQQASLRLAVEMEGLLLSLSNLS